MKYRNVAFLFPGQGAQYPGMAKDFAEKYPSARLAFEEADDVLGRKLSSIVLHGPEAALTETKNSQAGIYVACIAILRVLEELFPDLRQSMCAGLSLGEYTAVTASGRMGFADGLRLVQHRGQYMNDACEATSGAMAVILGMEAADVEALVEEVNLPHDLWAANYNCPGQVVISGTMKGIEAGAAAAKSKGAKRILPLQVHGAFHSGLMKSAEERLEEHVRLAPLVESPISLVMNVPGDFVKDIQEIRQNMIKQVTSPVRWEQGVRKMSAAGADLFLEIGCGKTLTGFNRRMQTGTPSLSVEKVADLEELEKHIR